MLSQAISVSRYKMQKNIQDLFFSLNLFEKIFKDYHSECNEWFFHKESKKGFKSDNIRAEMFDTKNFNSKMTLKELPSLLINFLYELTDDILFSLFRETQGLWEYRDSQILWDNELQEENEEFQELFFPYAPYKLLISVVQGGVK